MNKEITKVTLCFENCDDFTIYRKDIGAFYLGGFENYYSRIALNSISNCESASSFHIEIHKDANINENRNINFIDTGLPFERVVKWNDITQVGLEFENGDAENYYLQWEGDDDYNNEIQSSVISEVNGSLFITVDSKHKAVDFFSNEISDNDDYYWELYRA